MTSLYSDRQAYLLQCSLVKDLLAESKSNYYSNLVSENQSDLKKLFSVIGKLLHKKNDQNFPCHVSSNSLADAFIQFFENKIIKIRADMPQPNADNPFCIFDNPINSNCELSSFSSLTSNDLMVMISATSFKYCIDIVIPTIMKIVNMSLDSASLPHELKEAMLNPLLKKPAFCTSCQKLLKNW